VGITPLLYAMHHAIDRYLGAEESHRLMDEAAAHSPGLAL
jgi:hypothetical protein